MSIAADDFQCVFSYAILPDFYHNFNIHIKLKLNFINSLCYCVFFSVLLGPLICKRKKKLEMEKGKNIEWIAFYLNAFSSLCFGKLYLFFGTFDFLCVINLWEIWSNLCIIIFSCCFSFSGCPLTYSDIFRMRICAHAHASYSFSTVFTFCFAEIIKKN